MTTSFPRLIDADEAHIGDLIERRMGETAVRGRVFRVSDAGVAYDATGNILWWEGCVDSDWEPWLIERPETTAERFTREALAKAFLVSAWGSFMVSALEAMWADGWTVTPPADAEPEVQ